MTCPNCERLETQLALATGLAEARRIALATAREEVLSRVEARLQLESENAFKSDTSDFAYGVRRARDIVRCRDERCGNPLRHDEGTFDCVLSYAPPPAAASGEECDYRTKDGYRCMRRKGHAALHRCPV